MAEESENKAGVSKQLFKFKELRVYSSTEWLADNKKKYRQVYDRHETTYVYAELSFYNKLFDKEIWEVDVTLKCFSIKRSNKELCRLQFKKKVSKYDNVVYVREGWGNKKEGAFWKKGTYYWEAYVNDEKVATKYFYIEEGGEPDDFGAKQYLALKSLRLYEGQYDDVGEDDRNYYRTFSGAETRYVYSEAILENKKRDEAWQCEIFTKFYNEARELKGQVIRLQTVKKDDEEIKLTAGWGSNVKGSWREGRYTAELVFMDQLIAVIPFEVRENFEEGISAIQLPNGKKSLLLYEDNNFNQSFEEVMYELNALVGLHHIKKQVQEHAQYIKFLQLRKDKGFEEKEDVNVHSVFIGNPGTGKTTVAGMMGKLYKKMGLITKGHVHVVDRVDLVGEYIGQTAPKVKEAIEKARGGVLFIDEAYALARANDDSKDFGREVIEILVKEMSNGGGDLVVIVAGYPKEMKYFMDSNPGLKSRFNHSYKFDDYLPQELSKIAEYACFEKEVRLTEPASEKVDEIIVEAYRNRNRTFGNARYVYDIIEKAKINLGLRIMNSTNPFAISKTELSRIQVADILKIKALNRKILPKIPMDEKLLEESVKLLDDLIGMSEIKRQIKELIELVRYHHLSGKSVLNKFFFHTVFIGNPGTGKTTVARILTKIYKALGILERGHMVETDRQGLVAGFVGQTALKTAERIDESMGGVLFIDEAYSLTSHPSASGDFGNEVIQTILKRMEDLRGQFFIFAAGYPDNMESFLKANPGLSSRFDKILKFDDYKSVELQEIALKMIFEQGLKINRKASKHLVDYFQNLYKFRDKYFGNARTVRNVVQEAIKNQNLRLAALSKRGTKANPNLIIFDDVKGIGIERDKNIFDKKSIGFKSASSSN